MGSDRQHDKGHQCRVGSRPAIRMGLIVFGVFTLLSGNVVGGLWIAFIGWFLNSAADSSRRQVTMRHRLSGTLVRDVMDPNLETIGPESSVQELVYDVLRGHRRRAVPVIESGNLVGIVTIIDVRELAQDKWLQTRVKDIMTREPLFSVRPEDDLGFAMQVLAKNDVNQLLVRSDGQLLGMLRRSDIINHLNLTQELDIRA